MAKITVLLIYLFCFATSTDIVSTAAAIDRDAPAGLGRGYPRNRPQPSGLAPLVAEHGTALPVAGLREADAPAAGASDFKSVAAGRRRDDNSRESAILLDADEAARRSSNPLGGDWMIVFNRFDNFFLEGSSTDSTRQLNVWSVQPVVPVPMEKALGKNWIWVNRPEVTFILGGGLPDLDNAQGRIESALQPPGVPITDDDYPDGGLPFETKTGLGDITHASLLGKSVPHKWWGGGDLVWGLGAAFQFPTASDPQLGSGKYSAGPAGTVSFIGRKLILGGFYR